MSNLIECPKCGKRGVQYDPRCRSFVCLMLSCRAAWSEFKPDSTAKDVARQLCDRLITAVEGVQDWQGTEVGDAIQAITGDTSTEVPA